MADKHNQITEILTSFFRERLVPLASVVTPLFPLGPDARVETYYINRIDESDYIYELDPANLAGELREMWSTGDLPELAGLAYELVDLANQLQDREDDDGEISPFVYAMF